VELWDRYLLPRISKEPADADSQLGIDKGGDGFNTGFIGLKDYADQHGIPFIIFLHADMNEVVSGSYDHQGQKIIRFAEAHGIHLIKDLDHGVDRDMLRDKIHPNESGQRKIASIVLAEILANDTLLAGLR
jgi:hypothetical protein